MAELTLLLRRAKRNNEIKIDLSGKDISFIPNDLFNLTKVQILNLSNNRITGIDQKISQLTNLKVLDLSDNSIMEIPKQILNLSNLQALILDGNPLTKQFQILLNKNESFDLKKNLRRCFGLQIKEQQANQSPLWLNNDKDIMNNSKTFGKIIEIENKYKNQQSKVKELEKELEKMSMKEKKSSKQSFQLDLQPILEISFNLLEIYEQISMGGFSTIHRGQYCGLSVAVKKIFNPKINQQLFKEFSNQINMLAKFRHPNIVLLIGICSIPPNLAIVTQFIKNGSLYDLLHKKKIKLRPQQRSKIVKQMISAVNYLHSHDIAHRDIKSHNFLVDENYTVKLCDFGLAKSSKQLNQGPMQFSGTPVYMSQQLFLKKVYDKSVDTFALGTLLYQVYTYQIPYNGLDPIDIRQKIIKDSRLGSKVDLDKSILQIINKCRSEEPSNRPTLQWLMKYQGW